jgi:hypothetical protein
MKYFTQRRKDKKTRRKEVTTFPLSSFFAPLRELCAFA